MTGLLGGSVRGVAGLSTSSVTSSTSTGSSSVGPTETGDSGSSDISDDMRPVVVAAEMRACPSLLAEHEIDWLEMSLRELEQPANGAELFVHRRGREHAAARDVGNCLRQVWQRRATTPPLGQDARVALQVFVQRCLRL